MFTQFASSSLMATRHCRKVPFSAMVGSHYRSPTYSYHYYGTTTSLQMAKKSKSGDKALFRADRVLANRGVGSRSECFDLLKQKRVFQKITIEQVNNNDNDGGGNNGSPFKMERVKGPSEKLSMNASLYIDGKNEVPKPLPLLRVYHKPKWVLSVMSDNKGRPTVGDLDFFSSSSSSSSSSKAKMHPVGRLDYDTSGLLLFSSNGKLTQQLLHPNHEIEKEYVALVVGTVDDNGDNDDSAAETLKQKLAQGVTTSMGAFPADLLEAKSIPKEKVKDTIDDILKHLPEEYDMDRLDEKGYLFFKDATELSEIRLVVREGKHRMVRRILANSGFPVIGLKRERLGDIWLGDLPSGEYRELSEAEEKWANKVGNLKSKE